MDSPPSLGVVEVDFVGAILKLTFTEVHELPGFDVYQHELIPLSHLESQRRRAVLACSPSKRTLNRGITLNQQFLPPSFWRQTLSELGSKSARFRLFPARYMFVAK